MSKTNGINAETPGDDISLGVLYAKIDLHLSIFSVDKNVARVK